MMRLAFLVHCDAFKTVATLSPKSAQTGYLSQVTIIIEPMMHISVPFFLTSKCFGESGELAGVLWPGPFVRRGAE